MCISKHNRAHLGHNRVSGKELEHSIIGKILSIMCIDLALALALALATIEVHIVVTTITS